MSRRRAESAPSGIPSQTPFLRAGARRACLAAALLAAAATACGGGRPGAGGGEGGTRRAAAFGSSVEWAGLRFRVSARPGSTDRLRIRSEITNVSDGFRTAELPWCPVRVRLYRDGALVYDEAGTEGCAEGIRLLRLASGDSRVFRTTIAAPRILGDSLRPGPFDLRVRIPGRSRPGPPRAEMELRLGTVTLGDTARDGREER